MQLNRDQWTEETPLPYKVVPVPEIKPGAECLVWQLNGLEKDGYDTTCDRMLIECAKNGEQCPVSAIAACFAVKDAEGKRLFTADDIPAIAKRPGPSLDRVWEAFGELNRTTIAAQGAMQKNSEPASGSDSSSGSQESLNSQT